jgi:predicted ATPase
MRAGAQVFHLIERGTELGLLRSVVEAADAGRGSLAVMTGPAGIGKTSHVRRILRPWIHYP